MRRPGSEPEGTEAVAGDIAAEDDSLRAPFVAAAPDCVIHLAAEIASQRNQAKVNATNVDGTRRVVEAAGAAGRPKLVFCSTVVTGEANGELLEPGRPLPVETPYGRSKQEGERIVASRGCRTRSCARATSTGPVAGTRRSSSRACASRAGSP